MSGLPLLLLPGMMCDARLFTPQIAHFSRRRAMQCAPIGGHDSVAALARAVLENAPPRFALVGLSMGGIVGMEILAQAPQRVERLALLDTNPLAEKPDIAKARPAQIAQAQAGGLKELMREEFKPRYLADSPRRPAIMDLCMEMALDQGAEIFENQSRALMARPDQSETLRAYKRPCLILCGAQDDLCPLERHELMHHLVEGSRLRIIEGAGHLPPLEQPEAVNAALEEWLSL